MSKRFRGRPSPTTVIACLALFFAVAGGSAIALKGRNTVNSGDIKPKAVKTSDIANNAVTTKKIKNNHVRTADIQNGQVGTADLAGPEAFHRLGAAGEPAFGNGGQGDCLWSALTAPGIELFNAPGFYKSPFGEVSLTGAFTSTDGPGGDGACDADDIAEAILFTLPPGYRPAKVMVLPAIQFGSSSHPVDQLIIGGDVDVTAGPTTIPAGAVIAAYVGSSPGDQALIDGMTFRAAGPGNTGARRGSIEVTGEAADVLNDLLGN